MSGLNEPVSSLVLPQHIFVKAKAEIPASVFDAANAEEVLFLRHSKKPTERKPLVYEFTREPDLLQQYFDIYNEECTLFPEYFEAEKEYNRNGHILVARRGKQVVGGARLYVCTPRHKRKLLMELTGFGLLQHFPELEQKQQAYAELSRLVLLPDYRGTDILKAMIVNVYRKCEALGVTRLFATSTLPHSRLYKKVFNSVGLTSSYVHTEIDFPYYPGYDDKYYVLSALVRPVAGQPATHSEKPADVQHSVLESQN